MFKFLCFLGWHIAITKVKHLDGVPMESVNHYKCACGKDWMATSLFSALFYKIKYK